MLEASQMTPVLPERRVAELTRLVRTSIAETRRTVSPLTGGEVATIPVSSVDDVADAFAAARRAQQDWARTSLMSRQQMLLRLHDLVLDHQEELLDLIQLESGKSRAHAFDEIAHLALTARYYGRRLAKIVGPHRRSGVYPGLTRVQQVQQPKGVVGVISPWNYPLTMAISDGLAAIAAGNAVVHKPDSQSPLTALAGVELLRRAGFPPELWQVVSGQGSVVGHAIIERADYICFTGSTTTGKRVAAQCAERLIGCSLELGGKNPMIVLPGANVEKAAAGAVSACFSSAGQLCVSIERIYVPRRQFEAFRDALVRRVQAMSFGTALDWEADMGTLVSPAQLATVEKHVEDARAHGATVLTGGRARPDIGPWFYEPTVLENVPPQAECYAEETFGPLVSLYPYDTVDEAVAAANSGVYGLNASVWGPSRTARRVATRLKAGTVNVNEGFAATFGSIDAPMGGMRESGMGRRQGAEGLLRFTESQSIGAQSLLPVGGPGFVDARRFMRLLTFGLRLLKKVGRA
ncbi:succinate-semialdehyde dehydrogenase (NADP(+)) [Aeromicrobium phragmitis]|uniref:Succinate-semialdehyde dehydrogenase (NADP(+)) n=1 Tax=Aeromicrobium phragmitis TaxID=2478914 RepID=A0A3L8PQ37_9ACTN|nr:succinic semialdehyde dehydrogenase [Aeromicrobium phragmitis]RLV56558.1 succinate-semialdehyde dehydrogenase (NADP(+)) [Aeromicrobium phragmitis]